MRVTSGILCLASLLAAAAASAPAADAALLGFQLQNNMLCSGAYHQEDLAPGATMAQCAQLCREDTSCGKFSMQVLPSGGLTCSLYDYEVTVCNSAAGAVLGYKDTRCAEAKESEVATVSCPSGTVIAQVVAASYGTPHGGCGAIQDGACAAAEAREIVDDLCVGQQTCDISASTLLFGDPCPASAKSLRVEVSCKASTRFYEDTFFNQWSSRSWVTARKEVASRRLAWQRALAAVPQYPADKFSGRGVIIVAGGKYLQPALVSIDLLRQVHSQLRIQVWHMGAEEMTEAHRQLLAPYNVETRDFRDYVNASLLQPIASNVGMRLFQLKPLAILHSDLQEVLLLDSDNSALRDPAYLFDDATYQEKGSVFWPDYWQTSRDNPIWDIMGVPAPSEASTDSWEQESGQLLINKARAWEALNLCIHFNQEFYMRLLNGDKDTFRFAWLASNTSFAMVSTLPTSIGTLKELHSSDAAGFCGHTMLQHDMNGRPLFVHHNQLKQAALPLGENFRYAKVAGQQYSRYRSVPVSGLRLGSGQLIACNDIAGEGLNGVDQNDAAVEESGLGDFETRYFASLYKLSAKFQQLAGDKAAAALLSQTADADSLQDVTDSSSSSGISTSRRRRSSNDTVSSTCGIGKFELNAATCESIAVCMGGETATAMPTSTTDRLCASNSIIYSRTYEVAVSGSSYQVRVQGLGSFVPNGRIQMSYGANYILQMVGVPVSNPVEIRTVGNTLFSTGITGNGAFGSAAILVDTSSISASQLLYADSNNGLTGGAIDLSTATFIRSYSSGTFSNFGFFRFSTAYNPDVRLFTETSGTSNTDFDNLRSSCQTSCESQFDCLGIYIYRTSLGSVCYGLSDLGGQTDSSIDSESYTKIIAAAVFTAV